MHPNFYHSLYLLGLSQSLRSSHAEALATAEKAYSLAPWNTGTTGLLAGALMRAGQPPRAEELLQKLRPGNSYGTPLGLLVYDVVCSEIEHAADWAWRAFEQRDPRLITILVLLRSPSRALVRSHDSWAALAARLDIPSQV